MKIRHTMMVGLFASLLSAAALAGSDLMVKVEGISKAEGRVRVALYSQAKGFKKEKKAVTVQEVFATTEPVTVTVRDLPAGNYAVHVVHDQDGDGKFDHFIGLVPREGYGLSVNTDLNAEESFANSQFSHDGASPTAVTVQMRYCGNAPKKSVGKTLKCWISLSP